MKKDNKEETISSPEEQLKEIIKSIQSINSELVSLDKRYKALSKTLNDEIRPRMNELNQQKWDLQNKLTSLVDLL